MKRLTFIPLLLSFSATATLPTFQTGQVLHASDLNSITEAVNALNEDNAKNKADISDTKESVSKVKKDLEALNDKVGNGNSSEYYLGDFQSTGICKLQPHEPYPNVYISSFETVKYDLVTGGEITIKSFSINNQDIPDIPGNTDDPSSLLKTSIYSFVEIPLAVNATIDAQPVIMNIDLVRFDEQIKGIASVMWVNPEDNLEYINVLQASYQHFTSEFDKQDNENFEEYKDRVAKMIANCVKF